MLSDSYSLLLHLAYDLEFREGQKSQENHIWSDLTSCRYSQIYITVYKNINKDEMNKYINK